MQNEKGTDFKNSPVFVAGSTAVATIGLAVLIYKEVLLPTHTLSLQNDISKLKTESADYKSKIAPLEQNDKQQKEQIGLLLAKVRELEAANLFSNASPYPVSFGMARVGQPIADVEKAYPADRIQKKEDGFWTVKVSHAVISGATYYFGSDRKIYQILFHVHSDGKTTADEVREFLKTKISDVLGAPASNPRPGYYMWNTAEKLKVYVTGDRSFLLQESSLTPRTWPRD